MDTDSWLSITAIVVAVVLLFIVAASEAAIIYISRSRARVYLRTADERGEALHRYITERQRTLSALNLGRNLAAVFGTAAAMHLAAVHGDLSWQRALATAALSLVVIGVVDGIPDVVASRNPEFWGLLLTPLTRVLGLFFTPLAWLLDLPGRLIARLPLAPPRTPLVEEQEVLLRRLEMHEPGEGMEDDEREMIRGVIGLVETTAREIMKPRIDLGAVSTSATLSDVLDLIVEKGFSRIPLYEDSIDNIIGIVYAKDLLRYARTEGAPPALRDIARPPYFIPESKKVDDLLSELRANKIHIAIVVDEYGGTAGIVTTEDILEEIVGEIEDEYDTADPQIERVTDSELLLDGRVSVDEVNELLHTELNNEDVDTVGGFVANHLGKMPITGDEVRVDGVVIRVLDVQGNRIKRLRIEKTAGPVTSAAQ